MTALEREFASASAYLGPPAQRPNPASHHNRNGAGPPAGDPRAMTSVGVKPVMAVGMACDKVVGALLIGQCGVAVLAAGSGEAATITRAVASSTLLRKCQFLRFTPSAAHSLTLADVGFQAGIDAFQGQDSAAAMLAMLSAHQPASGRTVLVVEAAEALDAEALEFFERVATPSSQPLRMQLVLVGRAGFGDLLQRERFPHLYAMAAEALPVSGAMPEPPPSRPIADPVAAAAFQPPSAGASMRPWLVTALGLAVLVGGAAVIATFGLAPAPTSPHLIPSPAAPAPPPAPPSVAAPPATTAQQPLTDEARERLRQRFDMFLENAGRDSASLTPRQRQALFEEYLTSRGPADR